jgi:[ribosomal protein S5]-alanine N-acetyltransferase
VPHLQRLDDSHAAALLNFELENRAYFARFVPERGDGYFATFPARHASLLREQATGRCHFHVMVDECGAVLGRFNLVDVVAGSAEVGFRVAEREAGRGLAKEGVNLVCARAGDDYGLRTLVAHAAPRNRASLAVLRGTGFTPIGEVQLDGLPCVRHVRELTATAQHSVP